MANALTNALGQEVQYNDVPADVYRSFGFPGAEDMGNMFQFKRDSEQVYTGARSLEVSRSLNPSLQTFERWLAQNKSRIPLTSAGTASVIVLGDPVLARKLKRSRKSKSRPVAGSAFHCTFVIKQTLIGASKTSHFIS